MWIVNFSVDNFTALPTKCRLALDTPHLVATVNLIDARRARGTWLGLFANHSRR